MSTFTLNPPPQTLLARHRQLAPTAAVRVSPICLNTYWFDGDTVRSQSDAFGILDSFYSKGGNLITAGLEKRQSAEWLGAWMAARKNRDDIVLSVKCTGAWNIRDKHRLQSNYGGNSLKSMKSALDEGLSRLQTTYVDIYIVSWWDHTTSIPELMQGLNDMVTAGKVLYLGIGDTPAWIVCKANDYARQKGLRQFSVYRGIWNAVRRDLERDIVPMCVAEGMGICAYGVEGDGDCRQFMAQKQRQNGNTRSTGTLQQRYQDVAVVLRDIAQRKGVTLSQVAVAYLSGKAPYVFPTVNPTSIEAVDGCIASLAVSLCDEDSKKIDSASCFDFGYPHTVLNGTWLTGGSPMGVDHPEVNHRLSKLGRFDWVEKPKAIGRKEE